MWDEWALAPLVSVPQSDRQQRDEKETGEEE